MKINQKYISMYKLWKLKFMWKENKDELKLIEIN